VGVEIRYTLRLNHSMSACRKMLDLTSALVNEKILFFDHENFHENECVRLWWPIPGVGRPVPALQNSKHFAQSVKDRQDMSTFDHVWKFIPSGGCMNTEYMDVRRREIMLEFNRYVLCPVFVGKATKDQRYKLQDTVQFNVTQ
jgi:hypothetical protein